MNENQSAYAQLKVFSKKTVDQDVTFLTNFRNKEGFSCPSCQDILPIEVHVVYNV